MSGVADVLAAIFMVAVIYIMVKPNSLAPRFIKAFGQALDSIVKYAVSG